MKIESYLNFDGRCDEAIEFYTKALGAKVNMVMRFKDCPEPPPSGQFPPEVLNKVMHSSVTVGESTLLMTDGHCQAKPNFAGISLALEVANDAEAERVFGDLADGAKSPCRWPKHSSPRASACWPIALALPG